MRRTTLRSTVPASARRRKSERGQFLLLFVAVFTVFLALAAFAIDQGVWLGSRRVAQKDADTAARGGALAYLTSLTDLTAACTQAALTAKQNGVPVSATPPVTATPGVQSICMGSDPTGKTQFIARADCLDASGTPYNDDSGNPIYNPSVEVHINNKATQLFTGLPLLGGTAGGGVATGASAKACAVNTLSPYCLMVMHNDPTPTKDKDSLLVSGGGSLNISNCGVYVRASDTQGLDLTGNSTLHASQIDIYAGGALPTPYPGCAAHCTPAPTQGAFLADPLISLPLPVVTTPVSGTCITPPSGANKTLTPGVYCSTSDLTVSGTYHLTAGIYVFQSQITVQASATLTSDANQVLIYSTCAGYNSATNNLQPCHGTGPQTPSCSGSVPAPNITMQGTGKMVLKGMPAHGNVALWVDRTAKPGQNLTFNSTGNYGAIYAFCDAVKFQGGASFTGQMIADKIEFSGTSIMTLDPSYGLASGNHSLSLVQ